MDCLIGDTDRQLPAVRLSLGRTGEVMADIAVAIQSAIEVVQRLRALSRKIEDAEIKMLLADLSSDLADAKLEAANLKFEIVRMKEEVLVAQALAEAARTSVTPLPVPALVDGAYQFSGESGSFCTGCYDSQGKRIRLAALPAPFNDFGRWKCPVCNAILT